MRVASRGSFLLTGQPLPYPSCTGRRHVQPAARRRDKPAVPRVPADTFYAERTEQLRRDAQEKKLELLQRAEQKKAELGSLLSGSAPNDGAPSIGC